MSDAFLALVAIMLTAYVVLDGFDFGAGTLSLLCARSDDERRAVIAAIGPFWDGNEVWLIASGGVLMSAFPAALSAAFSGLYLAMFLVVWALILRGITVELLMHMNDGVGRTLASFVFGAASVSLSLLFGVALGNVVRGVPLSAGPDFDLPLFTSFLPRAPVGVLDVYTLLMGVLAAVALSLHGALYLAWKTADPLRARVRKVTPALIAITVVLYAVTVVATSAHVPFTLRAAPGLSLSGAALVAAWLMHRRGQDLRAFLGSCAFLVASLLGLAYARGAILLADVGHAADMTAASAMSPEGPLRPMAGIYGFGLVLVLLYFANLFRLHKGKLSPEPSDHDDPSDL
jgi:cytochrome d ubiquinol oxidase subunit II